MKVIGADGCGGGWFVVSLFDDEGWGTSAFPDIVALWESAKDASLILLDIPIGLREKGKKERLCDLEARKFLGRKRAMSVFPAPCRKALFAQNYHEACKINERMTGRKLTLQTWNIIPKIREVDLLISKDESARSHIREIHPEICFWALNNGPLTHSKKTEEGFNERRKLLEARYPYTDAIIKHALSLYRRNEVQRDDILDALVAGVTAIGGSKSLATIPESPELDSKGIAMEMIYLIVPPSA